MELARVKIKDLKPAEWNPRTISGAQKKKLAASIEKFGYIEPIVWNKQTGHVVGGHQRLSVMAPELGPEAEIDVSVVDLPESQEKALNIALNKISGEWDSELLNELLNSLNDTERDLVAFTGFEDDELLRILKQGSVDVDEVEEGSYEKAKNAGLVKTGDLFILGEHRLLCGDCTLPADVSRLVGESKIDLMVTDPPYNVDYKGKTGECLTMQNDKMDSTGYLYFCTDFLRNAFNVMKAGGAYYVFHADMLGHVVRNAVFDSGLELKQCLVWNKNSMIMGRQDYQWKHEPVLYGWKPGAAHGWFGDRKQTTVIDYDKPLNNLEHPTMKPVGLIEYLILNSSEKGMNVLDLFGGSGTTLIACEQKERKCFMMELDPVYVQVIIERWEKLTGKKATKVV